MLVRCACCPFIIGTIFDLLNVRFLWVTFQIESICRENTDDSILRALEDLPKDLPATYRRILRRLRDSGSTDPHTGKRIFEIVSAARRPLNVEELREAISIEPGNTTWDASKLVNDVIKSLDACGSLIVIDEELSTVHFAHSSVKQYLETNREKEDIPEYYTIPEIADVKLGEIVVTYLNLDVLQRQLSNDSKVPTNSSIHDASLLFGEGLSLSAGASSSLARKFLKSRKTPQFDIGRELERAVGFIRASRNPPLEVNSLLSYAREHWLSHTNSFNIEKFTIWKLFTRLVQGDSKTANTPWSSEGAHTLNTTFLASVAQSSNAALKDYTLYQIMGQGKEGVSRMEEFLLHLFLQDTPSHDGPDSYLAALRYAVKQGSTASVRWLLWILPAELIATHGLHHRSIYQAFLRDDLEVIKILLTDIKRVSAAASTSSVMETAASCSFQQIIPFLLAKGENPIPIKESYNEKVKGVLQLSYDFHKKNKVEELLQLSRQLYKERLIEEYRGEILPWDYFEDSDDIMRAMRSHAL